jgi:hypothetical protein
MVPDKLGFSKLYRLPFSKNDNFNGWLEVTTGCNMRCPGCYRRCDAPDHRGETKPLEAIRAEILELQRIRNCSMISISGGEPLLHPDLAEIVRFVAAHHMRPVLFTNGVLLDPDRLEDLARAGLTAVAVRIDSLQSPERKADESALNEVRARYTRLCSAAGVFLILTACIDRTNLARIKDVIHWARDNAPAAGQLLLILKRRLGMETGEDPSDTVGLVSLDELLGTLGRDVPDLSFAAYLGSQAEALSARWLQAFRFVLDGQVLGYAGKRFVETLQVVHHFRTGTYVGVAPREKNAVNLFEVLFLAAIDPDLRAVLRAFVRRAARNPLVLLRRVAVQSITIVVPPHFVDGKRDLCDACPDAMLHEGNLVPSCGLEEIKRFGRLQELA